MKKNDNDKIIISEITFCPICPTKKGIVAFVSFVINNTFKVNNVMIGTSLKRNGDYRLIYPVSTLPNGKDVQVFFPINISSGLQIESRVLSEWNTFLGTLNTGNA